MPDCARILTSLHGIIDLSFGRDLGLIRGVFVQPISKLYYQVSQPHIKRMTPSESREIQQEVHTPTRYNQSQNARNGVIISDEAVNTSLAIGLCRVVTTTPLASAEKNCTPWR
jgi:hypothetical protein